MADDNKPLKYARYAIGEIVLVVIGILIALQINNWNEERARKQELKIYMDNLVHDLNMKDVWGEQKEIMSENLKVTGVMS